MRICRLVSLVVLIVIFGPGWLLANHGPGASGGGAATISGEVLKPEHFELELREDYSEFQHFNPAGAIQRAAQGGDFDALDRGFFTSLSGAYGLFPNFQIGAGIGYFVGQHFVSSSQQPDGTTTVGEVNPTGFTDLVVIGKYRVLQGKPGNLSLIAGVVFPTGRSDVKNNLGEQLSPTDQPGTGRWGIPFGLAYSRFLTPRITIDASVLYIYRFEAGGFKVGDRFDAGMAIAYRLTESIRQFPNYSVFLELNNVYLAYDQQDGARDPNSGGDTLYLTPGFRVRFDKTWALTVAPSVPVYENLYGNQGRVNFKLAIALSYAY